jgi:hypothetical protein
MDDFEACVFEGVRWARLGADVLLKKHGSGSFEPLAAEVCLEKSASSLLDAVQQILSKVSH